MRNPAGRGMGRAGAVAAVLAAVALFGGPVQARDQGAPVDLVITDTSVFDARTGRLLPDRTVVVDDGRVVALIARDSVRPPAARTIDGGGRVLAPGLIDAHSHLAMLLGDSVSAGGGLITRLSADPDSVRGYRRAYAGQYLPYGVTTVRDAGSADEDVAMLIHWMRSPVPWAPDVHPVGGALVSHEEGRTPFPGHAVVTSPEDARAAVRAYHADGIRHVKLYWRLREPEFRATLDEARRLEMDATGHIDYKVLGVRRALELGLRSFEHAYTLAVGVMTRDEFLGAWRESLPRVIGDRQRGRFYLGVMQYFVDLGPDDPELLALIERLAETGSTVVPTLHLFAQRLGLAHYDRPALGSFDDMSGLSAEQLAHFREGYEIMAGYVRRMHEAGVRLAVGTDWVDPGRAVLSEMRLLHRAGIPMHDVLRIATLESARALGLEDVGAVEPGMKAHLVLFDGGPLTSPEALLRPATVIKDGVIVEKS